MNNSRFFCVLELRKLSLTVRSENDRKLQQSAETITIIHIVVLKSNESCVYYGLLLMSPTERNLTKNIKLQTYNCDEGRPFERCFANYLLLFHEEN